MKGGMIADGDKRCGFNRSGVDKAEIGFRKVLASG